MVVKHRVAVLMHDVGRAVELAELLEKRSAIAVLTTSSDELYQALNRNPIDLIVIEQGLAGFLTGVEILERLFSDLLRPTTLLLGELSKEEQRRVEAIGVQRVLAPESSPEQIVSTIQQLLRSAAHEADVISPAARHIVQRADYIQPLPQLLVKLVTYLRDDNLDVTRLVRDISTDPLIAADLLRHANSSAVARRQPTTKISDAVNYLGARKAIGVAISTGMLRARGALLGDLPPSLHQWHSSRAVLTACTAA
ncbi:MAG: HDOD domain-containing protein, partial [Planctomycetes bacterium]|nr:HDOD domain-containing protein [Planctomycetota bacterium]